MRLSLTRDLRTISVFRAGMFIMTVCKSTGKHLRASWLDFEGEQSLVDARVPLSTSTQTFVCRLVALRARTAFIIRIFHTYTRTPEPLIGSAPCNKCHLCQFVTLLKPGHRSSVYMPPERMLSLLIPDQSRQKIKRQPLVWQPGALTSPRLFWTLTRQSSSEGPRGERLPVIRMRCSVSCCNVLLSEIDVGHLYIGDISKSRASSSQTLKQPWRRTSISAELGGRMGHCATNQSRWISQ